MFTRLGLFLQILIVAALIPSLCQAQGESVMPSGFTKPDAIITVREHPLGAELVQVTMIRGDYPKELLVKQCKEVAALLQSDIRGLSVANTSLGPKPEMSFLRANFAVDNMISGENIRLEPFLKAFAGAPEPYTVRGIKVLLQGVKAGPKRVQKLSLPGILEAEGVASSAPPGLEYQFTLLTQDPNTLTFPERYEAAKPSPKTDSKATQTGPDIKLLIGLFIIAGLALGALVYFALTRTSSSRR